MHATTSTPYLTNGDRLRNLRLAKGWTQDILAGRSGFSVSAIRKYENGQRSLDRGSVILALAKALDAHPVDITGHPYPVPPGDHDGQIATGAVAAIYRALMVHGRPPAVTEEEAAAVDLGDLAARVAEACRHRQRAALASSAKVLPALLRDLQIAVTALPAGPDRRIAYDLLASGYECAMQLTYKLGHVAIATLATERVVWSALETGDPLRIIAARWYEAGEFINLGEHDIATDITEDALRDLARPAYRGDPAAISLRGAMHLKQGLNAARAADGKTAEASWRRAQTAADDLGADRNDYELQFGPTNCALWGVTLPLELGRGRDAVRRAEGITLPDDYADERRAHFYIDLGRAHWYAGNRDAAIESFLRAEEIAPQQTRMHAGVRETVTTMIRTARPGALQEFALRAGVL
jgi:transcriptional regulator with XRE-family HTH domain